MNGNKIKITHEYETLMSSVCHSICVLLEDITLGRWKNSSQYAKVQSFFYRQNAIHIYFTLKREMMDMICFKLSFQ